MFGYKLLLFEFCIESIAARESEQIMNLPFRFLIISIAFMMAVVSEVRTVEYWGSMPYFKMFCFCCNGICYRAVHFRTVGEYEIM